MDDLTGLSIFEAAELLRSRALSPVELAQAHLARIDALDGRLNCYITRTGEQALAEARAAEAEIGRGAYRGPLHGIPLALKDLYSTRGVRTTAGSSFLADHVPDEDAVATARLAEAGAVLLGKLNMHEWALGLTNDNPHYGPARNPWDTRRVPGGSSGGSGAALAAGLCVGSLGSDTGGSIRVPAALCGIVGLKPTFGRVSARGVVPLSWNLDHCGPMARRIRDAALLLQAIAGYDPEDPYSVDVPTDDYLAGIDQGAAGLRVALVRGAYVDAAEPEVLAAVRAAAEVLAGLGAHVAELELDDALDAARMNALMTTSDAAAYHRDRLRDAPERFGDDVRTRMQMGAAFTSTEYILARRTQTLWKRRLDQLFARFDLLLLPTTPMVAPKIGGDALEAAKNLTRFTAPFNLAHLPALSLPCGFGAEGLPIGLQLVARPWAEALLLRAGQAYEQATEWHARRPALGAPAE
jgi:aspartyl-tRNA(Asn)/glutamyl-tRNA(Gln) amidotransferase subunit A